MRLLQHLLVVSLIIQLNCSVRARGFENILYTLLDEVGKLQVGQETNFLYFKFFRVS